MSRFSDYLQATFDFSASETEEIIAAMKKPIGKSIRVNTRKIALSEFTIHAKEQGWELTPTDIPEVFLIDREDTTIALGNTLEHQAGWFYIQEVAAAHPPFLLQQEIQKAKGKVQNGGIILDMCAAPGGKTTQLADYFPDSLVIANEVNRTRTPQLFDNLDRMGYDNIAVVSCDGRFFQNFPEFFDAVLLDAPCSGEGTAFRDGAVIDHWHEKNIDRIAKLQKQLMETAETVVKPEGFLSYSTCTLNKEENEKVIFSILDIDAGGTFDGKSTQNHREEINSLSTSATSSHFSGRSNSISPRTPESNFEESSSDNGRLIIEDGSFERNYSKLALLFSKRFWPHIEHTGGFFASIFQKKSREYAPLRKGDVTEGQGDLGINKSSVSQELTAPSKRSYPILAAKGQQKLIVNPVTKGEREIVERFISKNLKTKLKPGFLFVTKDGVYFNQRNLGPLAQHFYFVHAGMRIGTIKNNTFTPTHHLLWCLAETSNIPQRQITREEFEGKVKNPEKWCVGRYGRGIVGIVPAE